MDTTKPLPPPSPWHPTTDPLSLAIMGKTLEELGELVAALSRCVIQGIDEVHPVSGKPNKRWVEEELADVYSTCLLLSGHFNLDPEFMADRQSKKIQHLTSWFALIP